MCWDLYLPWERKGKRQKREREVCTVSDLTQQINIFLFNYLNRCWLPRTETIWRKEQLREQAQLSSVFPKPLEFRLSGHDVLLVIHDVNM